MDYEQTLVSPFIAKCGLGLLEGIYRDSLTDLKGNRVLSCRPPQANLSAGFQRLHFRAYWLRVRVYRAYRGLEFRAQGFRVLGVGV